MLWDFAEKVEPFACKDVEVALTELGEEAEKNRNLSKNLTDTIDERKALKNETLELEKNLKSLNETSKTEIEELKGSIQSMNKTLLNEKTQLKTKIDELESTLNDTFKTSADLKDQLQTLNESLIQTKDEKKILKDNLEKLNGTTENLTPKPEVNKTETLINQANLGSTGSSPGILALVACVAFIFGCATVIVCQQVRKRKGNAGKSFKNLP